MTLFLFLFGAVHLYSNDDFYYSYIPKKVYQNEVFPLTIATEKYKDPKKVSIAFDSENTLFKEPSVENNKNGLFFTFYFKANESQNIITPSFEITANGDNFRLKPLKITVNTLELQKDFSGVYASKFEIKNSQISEYNEGDLLVSLSLEAFEANLEDFHLANIKEQSIEDISRDFANIEGEYFAIVPKSQKTLSFSYYNTLQEKFVSSVIALEIKTDPTNEQLDINPKDSSFDLLKKYLFMFLVIMFSVLYYFKRDKFYLFFGILSMVILGAFYMPKERVCIKKGSNVYILPTKTSTVSATTTKKLKTMALDSRGKYIKVEYDEGLIGWIGNEDVCED